MNKITLGIVSTYALLMAGCTTIIPAAQPVKELEPILVGRPVTDRIQGTEIEINNQLGLLQTVKTGKKITSYNIVTHNNDLDARLGSSMTLPKAYANSPTQIREGEWSANKVINSMNTKSNINDLPPSPLLQKVKRIEWSNNSLNKLAGNIGKALGSDYQLVIKNGRMSDAFISFNAEKMTLGQVIDKLKKENASFVDIVVLEENKTFNILYK